VFELWHVCSDRPGEPKFLLQGLRELEEAEDLPGLSSLCSQVADSRADGNAGDSEAESWPKE